MKDISQAEMIARLFGRKGGQVRPKPLPRQAVEHDSVDKMQFDMYADDSPRFRRIAVDERLWVPCWTMRLYLRGAATICRASKMLCEHGFST